MSSIESLKKNLREQVLIDIQNLKDTANKAYRFELGCIFLEPVGLAPITLAGVIGMTNNDNLREPLAVTLLAMGVYSLSTRFLNRINAERVRSLNGQVQSMTSLQMRLNRKIKPWVDSETYIDAKYDHVYGGYYWN